jgi:hypothetical protein
MKKVLNFERKNLYLLMCFFIIFFIGINSYKDYGVSSDEPNSRLKGMISANYLGEKFIPKIIESYKKNFSIKTNKNYNTFNDLQSDIGIKYYGVAFELPAFLIERILNVNDKHKQYELKHFLTFLVFFLSLISFYKLLNFRYQNWVIGILGVVMLFLSPRIFANSFYNNKDLVFLSFFIFSIHASLIFLEKQNFRSLIYASLFCALAIDVRIMGIITPIILLCTLLMKKIVYSLKTKFFFKIIFQYLFFLFFFVIIFWPFLWANPIGNFLEAYNVMSKYPLEIYNFFLGEYILSTEIPKYYSLVWIAVTTPLVYVLFFFVGLFFFIINFSKKKNERFNENFFKDFFCLSILLSVFTIIIYLGSTLYNGWRQLYFLYSLIIYVSIFGIYEFYLFLNNNYRKYLIGTLIISFVFTSYWMKLNHPHQYVYFNILAGKNFDKKFEMDYWGLSYKENLEYLIKNENKELFKIFNLSINEPERTSVVLPEFNRKKLQFVKNQINADYLITNYYYGKGTNYDSIEKDYKILNEIKVDGVSINTLYKKINE